jgi:TonB-linked SusC/RagA family outer membrane protein
MIRNSTEAISYNTKVYRLNWRRLKFIVLLSALLQLVAAGTYAQAIKITGQVTDHKNQALPGAGIVVKGTKTGTSTDIDGRYSITVADKNAVLIFSTIGYSSQEIPVSARTIINVKLLDDAKDLTEVVVVGYGALKKRDVTGAVTSANLGNVTKTPVFGTAQLLQGQVSGVQVTQTNAQPGASFSVRIRGTNSITNSSEPLYVVDGYAGADISALNPNDIATMDVLKDASAAAIYGNRGSNGVVIITTKTGKAGQNIVSADVYSGVQRVGKVLEMMNASQFAIYLDSVTAYNNVGSKTPKPLPFTQDQINSLGTGTNWQKELFRTAPVTNANVSISGGSELSKYLVSFSYFDQKGIIINSGYKRGTLRFNFTHDISRKVSFGLNSQLSYDQQNKANVNTSGGAGGGTLLDALRISPTVPVFDATGDYTFQNGPSGYTNILGNPVAAAMLNTDIDNSLRVFINAYGEYKILENLKFRASVGTDDRFERERLFRPNTTYLGLTTNGLSQIINPQNLNWLNENTLTYNTTINKIHSITALAGFTYQYFQYKASTATAQSLTTNNLGTDGLGAGTSLSASSTANGRRLASFIGRVNYSLLDKYLLTVSLRRDGSSALGINNQWGAFPSAALAWRVSGEDFMKGLTAINNLKLRLGYGIVGNADIPVNAPYLQYGLNSYVLNGSRNVGFSPNNIANPNLQWEQTKSYNIGLDLGMFNNRLTFNADIYDKKTAKLLFQRPVPSTTGFSTFQDNLGAMSNRGVELALNTVNINGQFVKWTTGINFARNINKILDLGGPKSVLTGTVSSSLYPGGQNSSILQLGKPIGSFYGYVYDGIWQSQEQITASGLSNSLKPGDPRYKDLNNDHIINASDRTIIGKALPKFTYGFNSNLTVGQFNLFVLIQGVYGNQIMNENKIEGENGSTGDNKLAYVLTRSFGMPGSDNSLPSVGSTLRRSLGPTSDVLESGSYLRFKTITLSYDLPLPKLSSVFKSASIYVTGQNMFTITKYSGYDPEVNTYDTSSGNYTSLGTDYNPLWNGIILHRLPPTHY